MKKGVLLLLSQLLMLTALAQDLRSGFLNPPQEARPRVWWHWMNGNITRDGIRKDIEWMHRAGIGGFHCFDAGMGMKPVVEQRLDYMSEPWKDAFRLAVRMADSLGMEVAVASCPGWSNTGGPWVRPEQAMKRLVWTETVVKGGRKQSVMLPMPKHDRWYDDISVLALRLPDNDKTLEEMGGQITVSRESDEKNGRLSLTTATLLFILYSIINGATLASIFAVYSMSVIGQTFLVTAGTFGAMAVYGYFTKKDLTSWGRLLLMALIGLIIAGIVNLFLHNSTMDLIVSGIGVLVFVGLTAYDSQKIKHMLLMQEDMGETAQKVALMGALSLYLDFINLFLYLLRFMGRER